MRRLSSVRSERGIALILVLVLLPLVAILMTQLTFETTIGTRLSTNTLATAQFKMAISARIRQMRLRLVRDLKNDEANAQEGGAFDHVSDSWGPDLDGGGTARKVSRGDDETGDVVTLYTEVFDEQGKFNLNLLLHRDPQRAGIAFQVFKRMLDFYRDSRFDDLESNDYDLTEAEAQEIAEAVRKFLKGERDDERVKKVELPDPGPDMKQGVFSVRELMFAHRLFTEKRLFERIKDPSTGETLPSLEDLITLYGDGKINPNTAPIQVLRALFKEEEGQRDLAEAILHGRGGYLANDQDQDKRDEELEERREADEEGLEEEPTESAYRTLNELTQNVEGMGDASMLRRNEIDVARDFTVRSNFFLVVVTAQREKFFRQHRVVLERHLQGTIIWSSEIRHVDAADLPEAMATDDATDEDHRG